MDDSSYFRFGYDKKTKYVYIIPIITSELGKFKHTAPYIVKWVTEGKCLILLTYSTKYIWQAFY